MAFAVALSMVVALTLCPMLASRILSDHPGPAAPSRNPLTAAWRRSAAGPSGSYHRLLDMALAAPGVVSCISLLFAGAAAFTYTLLPEQLTPREDRGIIPISVSAPQGVDVEYLDAQMRQIEALVAPALDSGEVVNTFMIAGMFDRNSGFVMLTLAPWEERTRSQAEIAEELRPKLQAHPRRRGHHAAGNSLGIRGGGQGLRFAITGHGLHRARRSRPKPCRRAGGPARLRTRHARLRHHAAGTRHSNRSRGGVRPWRLRRGDRHDFGHAADGLRDGANITSRVTRSVPRPGPDGTMDDPRRPGEHLTSCRRGPDGAAGRPLSP
jgi:multidrug efflux pump subunit AcrB